MKLGVREGVGMLLALVVVALALTGCGGASDTAARSGGGASSAPASSVSQALPGARLIARADAICTSFNAKIAAIAPRSGSRQEVERVVPRHVAVERAAIAELEKLAPPASLVGGWNSMLGYRRRLAAELDKLLLAAERRDKSSVNDLTISKQHVHRKLRQVADKAGFRACGTVG